MTPIIVLALIVVTVFYVLPKMPRLARVGFWAVMTVIQIATGDALFAAFYAAIATAEWHKP